MLSVASLTSLYHPSITQRQHMPGSRLFGGGRRAFWIGGRATFLAAVATLSSETGAARAGEPVLRMLTGTARGANCEPVRAPSTPAECPVIGEKLTAVTFLAPGADCCGLSGCAPCLLHYEVTFSEPFLEPPMVQAKPRRGDREDSRELLRSRRLLKMPKVFAGCGGMILVGSRVAERTRERGARQSMTPEAQTALKHWIGVATWLKRHPLDDGRFYDFVRAVWESRQALPSSEEILRVVDEIRPRQGKRKDVENFVRERMSVAANIVCYLRHAEGTF